MATDLDPNEEDAGVLWAEIHRLRAAVQGPDGYETWQQAAVAERVRRVKAEAALAAAPAPKPEPAYLSDAWVYRYAQEAAFVFKGPSYTPKTAAEAKNFLPHVWVQQAIQSAWIDGLNGKPRARCPQLGDAPEIPSTSQGTPT